MAVGTANQALIGGTTPSWGKITNLALGVGPVVQIVNVLNTTMSTGSTAVPHDDTIPQNTEGDQIMTLAITPLATTDKLLIRAVVNFSNATAEYNIMSLYQDSTANALASVETNPSTSTQNPQIIVLEHFMTAGTTSATTFKIRIGGQTGVITINGENGVRKLGGAMTCSLTITEVAA